LLLDPHPDSFRRLGRLSVSTVADVVAVQADIVVDDGVIPGVVKPRVRVIPGNEPDQLGLSDAD
jgi:hypothetical protein